MSDDDFQCCQCDAPIVERKGFQINDLWYCPTCFVKKAQERKSISAHDVKRLKRAVKEELAGYMPDEVLQDVLEIGFRKIERRPEDRESVFGWMKNEMRRQTALAISGKLLEAFAGLHKALEEQENDIRTMMRRISEL